MSPKTDTGKTNGMTDSNFELDIDLPVKGSFAQCPSSNLTHQLCARLFLSFNTFVLTSVSILFYVEVNSFLI